MAKRPAKKSVSKGRKAAKRKTAAKPKAKAAKKSASHKSAQPKKKTSKGATKSKGKSAAKKSVKRAAKKKPAKRTAKRAAKKTAKKKTTKRVVKKKVVKKKAVKKTVSKKKPAKSKVKPQAKSPAKRKAAPEPPPQPKRVSRSQYEVPPQVENEKLTRAQIREFRMMLEAEGARLIQEVGRLESQNFDSSPGDKANRFGNHLADVASDSQILETLLVQSGMEAERLRQINEALERIDRRKHGICERCGANIGYERLLAKPFARFCIVCREHMEKSSQRFGS